MTQAASTQQALQAAGNSLQQSFSTPTQRSGKLGKDDFLKLMMAQATNQDPLNPMDSQGMMQQLTGMGSLEQLMNLNDSLGTLQRSQNDIVRSNTFSFLDKDVTVRGGALSVRQGGVQPLRFGLPGEAENVLVAISDAGGQPVRSLTLGAYAGGEHRVEWDGKDSNGYKVSDGTYRYSVSAKNSEGNALPVNLFSRGKVSGVKFVDGRPSLVVNGESVDISDVTEMSNRSERLFNPQLPAALRREMEAARPALREERR